MGCGLTLVYWLKYIEKDGDSMTFGERLKRLREGRYSQEELAEMLNVHSVTISKWENGVQEPRAKKVAELARILGTTTAYLLGDTDNPTADYKVAELPSPAPQSVSYPNLSYWGEVADNARAVATNGNKEEIADVSYLLTRALASLRIAGRDSSQPAMA